MEDKRSRQVLIIIVCIGIIVTSIYYNVFIDHKGNKVDSAKKVENISKETENKDNSAPVSEVPTATSEASKEKENKNEPIKATAIKDVDTGLYDDNPESEAAPEGMDIRIAFTNGDVLYSGGYPSGVFKNMMLDYQNFINKNIKNPEEITEVAIQEDTIKEDKENKKLQYDVKLNDGTSLAVEVDLYTFEYKFQVK